MSPVGSVTTTYCTVITLRYSSPWIGNIGFFNQYARELLPGDFTHVIPKSRPELVVDREQGASEILTRHGVVLIPLVRVSELL